MRTPVYGYMRVPADNMEARHIEQQLYDFCEENGLLVVAMFREARPHLPRLAFNDMVTALKNKEQRVFRVVIPSLSHLDEAEWHAGNLRLGLEVITDAEVAEAGI